MSASPLPAAVLPVPRLWRPKRVLVTPAALAYPHGRAMVERAEALGADVTSLKANRLMGLGDADPKRAYINAKTTLAVVVAPPTKLKLQPIPPSADWRFDLAEGCPAHCQYCYLAGSLSGPPVTRAYANIEEILSVLPVYAGQGTITSQQAERRHEGTTFEASCYTDPLGIEHLTGSLARAISYFGAWDADVQLRFTTKFDAVEPLLGLEHGRRTRMRISVNAEPTLRFEGGTAPLASRFQALRRMALAGYRAGLTIAPIMPIENWRDAYEALLAQAANALHDVPDPDLTVELITHRFTPGSKQVLTGWYPGSSLDMREETRSRKHTKFGSVKYGYASDIMRDMRAFFHERIAQHLPYARVLYWT